MAVGPNQVRGITLDACILGRFAPCEGVKRKVKLMTGSCEGVFDLAVHMRLPVQRTQWGEVVRGVRPYPGKPVSAFHFASLTLAQRTFRIVNPRLRYHSKDS